MLARIVVSIIGSCVTHARLAVAPIGVVRALYAASRFRLNSDIIALPPANVERPREKLAFEKAFQRYGLLDVVVKAPTPEVAGAATGELRSALAEDKARFRIGRGRRGRAAFLLQGERPERHERLPRMPAVQPEALVGGLPACWKATSCKPSRTPEEGAYARHLRPALDPLARERVAPPRAVQGGDHESAAQSNFADACSRRVSSGCDAQPERARRVGQGGNERPGGKHDLRPR